jgi:hypothetical protein
MSVCDTGMLLQAARCEVSLTVQFRDQSSGTPLAARDK